MLCQKDMFWLGRDRTEALSKCIHELLDAAFPPRCLVCGESASGNGWCCRAHDWSVVEPVPRCLRCALPLPRFAARDSLCPDCAHSPPPIQRLAVLTDYEVGAPLRDWILALKHGGRRDLAGPLGRALGLLQLTQSQPAAGALSRGLDPKREIYVPVPLHPLRLLERGYDQARELARAASQITGLPCVRGLRRVRYTLPQGSVGSPARLANLRGAIVSRRGSALQGKRVWLVDDVVTSGATLAACALAAKRQGASEVWGLALARASPLVCKA